MCGEHVNFQALRAPISGSSPRVRGTHHQAEHPFFVVSVHPRVCGEHLRHSRAVASALGSSPRVRGTRRNWCHSEFGLRFIPACAGNTTRPPVKYTRLRVHPRVCGEHAAAHANSTFAHGSSPRVRGTLALPGGRRRLQRFIPACAGNTPASDSRWRFQMVHPRVCGEHRSTRSCANAGDGSSPRVRGTRLRRRGVKPVRRFIPACAGNTTNRTRCSPRIAVHPRVCGEHYPIGPVLYRPAGSSPRVRGTR